MIGSHQTDMLGSAFFMVTTLPAAARPSADAMRPDTGVLCCELPLYSRRAPAAACASGSRSTTACSSTSTRSTARMRCSAGCPGSRRRRHPRASRRTARALAHSGRRGRLRASRRASARRSGTSRGGWSGEPPRGSRTTSGARPSGTSSWLACRARLRWRWWATGPRAFTAGTRSRMLGLFVSAPNGSGSSTRRRLRSALTSRRFRQRRVGGELAGEGARKLVAWDGIEPPTRGFSVRCSTN